MDISKMIELARTSAVSFLYCVRAARQRDPAKPSHFVSTCIAMEGYIERAIDRLKSVNPEVSGIDDQIRIFLGALDRLVGVQFLFEFCLSLTIIIRAGDAQVII